ncbi:hypothetical protein OIO90_001495 [Microbotryomycetes sp. JL221]|nr:hypothetical protein OIO90_001495 [Microbotryomycetes sp. JL221]
MTNNARQLLRLISNSRAICTSAKCNSSSTTTSTTKTRPAVPTARDFRYFCAFQTRWKDNDVYAHLNNIEYNAYFDSIVNQYMLHHVGTRLPHPAGLVKMTTPLGLAVSSTTSFASSISYPNPCIGALSIEQIGKSSVTWKVGLFEAKYLDGIVDGDGGFFFQQNNTAKGSNDNVKQERLIQNQGQDVVLSPRIVFKSGYDNAKAAAYGTFKHVFTNPETQKSVEIPKEFRRGFERVLVEQSD